MCIFSSVCVHCLYANLAVCSTVCLDLSLLLCAYVAHPLSCSVPHSLSPHLSPPLCPWGPSPFILTPRAITISVVTAGHVTCTCSSGWSPHAGAIWPHTHACTHTSPLGCLLPSLPPRFFMALLLNRSITLKLFVLSPPLHSFFCCLNSMTLFKQSLFPLSSVILPIWCSCLNESMCIIIPLMRLTINALLLCCGVIPLCWVWEKQQIYPHFSIQVDGETFTYNCRWVWAVSLDAKICLNLITSHDVNKGDHSHCLISVNIWLTCYDTNLIIMSQSHCLSVAQNLILLSYTSLHFNLQSTGSLLKTRHTLKSWNKCLNVELYCKLL